MIESISGHPFDSPDDTGAVSSDPRMPLAIAYLADGKLFLKQGDDPPRLIESPFVQQMLDRVQRSSQRNNWKNSGMGWQFSAAGMMGMAGAQMPQMRRVRFSGLTRGTRSGELLYALDTDHVGGLFTYDVAESYERRLYHRNQFRAQSLSRHPSSGTLALSVRADDGTAHIAILGADGKGLKEVTEGDCVDEAPQWTPGEKQVLVFQSAGVGRNQAGVRVALGPYAVQKLDLDSNDFVTVLEEDEHDLLLPRMTSDGSLLFIRRPYDPDGRNLSPWKVLLDVALFPYRLIVAIVAFLNWFSHVFARKPLITSGGPPREGPDARYLMLWGKMIDAEKAIRAGREGDGKSLVPATWQLIRRAPDGSEQSLARHVLSFDLAEDGSIIYSNGSTIYQIGADGKSSGAICTGKMIEHVSVV
jgi:hypothetical protein